MTNEFIVKAVVNNPNSQEMYRQPETYTPYQLSYGYQDTVPLSDQTFRTCYFCPTIHGNVVLIKCVTHITPNCDLDDPSNNLIFCLDGVPLTNFSFEIGNRTETSSRIYVIQPIN